MGKIKMYKVEQYVVGGFRKENFYFDTREKAKRYSENNEYCSNVRVVSSCTEEQAKELINDTRANLARRKYYNGPKNVNFK